MCMQLCLFDSFYWMRVMSIVSELFNDLMEHCEVSISNTSVGEYSRRIGPIVVTILIHHESHNMLKYPAIIIFDLTVWLLWAQSKLTLVISTK